MEITVIGSMANLEETQRKFGDRHRYTLVENYGKTTKLLAKSEVVFDFNMENDSSRINIYHEQSCVIFLNTSTVSLSQLGAGSGPTTFFGFCGLPTFLDREILEVSLTREEDRPELEKVCAELKTSYQVVADKVGLVTPRIICMIINEAYCTVEEGIATREDIDRAMKLGTNYPWGPFEWCERIGKNKVRQLLDALHRETGDERYRVCELLKKE